MSSGRLIITPGEPAGIGGEILLKAINRGAANLVTIDDPERLMELASAMGIRLRAEVISSIDEALILLKISLPYCPWSGLNSLLPAHLQWPMHLRSSQPSRQQPRWHGRAMLLHL